MTRRHWTERLKPDELEQYEAVLAEIVQMQRKLAELYIVKRRIEHRGRGRERYDRQRTVASRLVVGDAGIVPNNAALIKGRT